MRVHTGRCCESARSVIENGRYYVRGYSALSRERGELVLGVMSDAREDGGHREESTSGSGGHPHAGQASVESIQVLARALSGSTEGALRSLIDGFWSRLDARLACFTDSIGWWCI